MRILSAGTIAVAVTIADTEYNSIFPGESAFVPAGAVSARSFVQSKVDQVDQLKQESVAHREEVAQLKKELAQARKELALSNKTNSLLRSLAASRVAMEAEKPWCIDCDALGEPRNFVSRAECPRHGQETQGVTMRVISAGTITVSAPSEIGPDFITMYPGDSFGGCPGQIPAQSFVQALINDVKCLKEELALARSEVEWLKAPPPEPTERGDFIVDYLFKCPDWAATEQLSKGAAFVHICIAVHDTIDCVPLGQQVAEYLRSI